MEATELQNQMVQTQSLLATIAVLNFTSYLSPIDKGTQFDGINSPTDAGFYDYIIIGLGTSGSIMAKLLSQNNTNKVLGIEAGDVAYAEALFPGLYNYLENSNSVWNFTTPYNNLTNSEHQGNVIKLTSGRVLGGSSSSGYSIYVRGDYDDYSRLANATNNPQLSYNNILPYLKVSERLEDKAVLNSPYSKNYGKNGSIGLSRQPDRITGKYFQALREMNKKVLLDSNGNSSLGYVQPMFGISGGFKESALLTFLTETNNRSNLDVFLKTLVTKLLIDDQNNVYGIQAKRKNGKILTARARKEVIVCCGTFKSPHLLMLSGIGIEKDLKVHNISLKADLPVGKGLQDHAGVVITQRLSIKTINPTPNNPHKFSVATIMGNAALDEKQGFADYRAGNFIIPSNSEMLLTQCSIVSGFKDNICQSLYNQTKGYETVSTKIRQTHPRSRGYVKLRSTNPDEYPIIEPCYFCKNQDLEDTVDYIMDFLQIQNTSTFQRYGAKVVYPTIPVCDNLPMGSREQIKCFALRMVTPVLNLVGTCSMGSVVDQRFRVYKMKRLRVVDASVIPLLLSGGAQAAVQALANMAADIILQDN